MPSRSVWSAKDIAERASLAQWGFYPWTWSHHLRKLFMIGFLFFNNIHNFVAFRIIVSRKDRCVISCHSTHRWLERRAINTQDNQTAHTRAAATHRTKDGVGSSVTVHTNYPSAFHNNPAQNFWEFWPTTGPTFLADKKQAQYFRAGQNHDTGSTFTVVTVANPKTHRDRWPRTTRHWQCPPIHPHVPSPSFQPTDANSIFLAGFFVTPWALSNRYPRHLCVPLYSVVPRHAPRTNDRSLLQIGTKSENTKDITFVKSSSHSSPDFARNFLGQQRQAHLPPTCSLRLFRSSYCPPMFRN